MVLLLLYLFRKPLGRIRIVRKIADFLMGILDGLKTIYRMKRKWEFILHSVLIWFLYIMMTWVVVFALKETSGLTFVDGMFLLVIGGLGMSAPVTAGFGAFHWITSRGLVFVYGLTLEQGGAYAILAHESNSLLTHPPGSPLLSAPDAFPQKKLNPRNKPDKMLTYEDIVRKLITPEEALTLFSPEFRRRNKIVFTNGCFDVLHRGHIYYLSKAREMGDLLVVGLNSDAIGFKAEGRGKAR